MSNSLTLFKKFGLVNSGINYSEVANAFLSTGYTSAAGNTYFNSFRFAEGILIKEDAAQEYARSFLNGIKIYSVKDKILLAEKHFHCVFYSKGTVKHHAKKMLLSVLKDAAANDGYHFDQKKANQIIDKVLTQAMNEDQRKIMVQQTQKYLSA